MTRTAGVSKGTGAGKSEWHSGPEPRAVNDWEP